MKNQARVKRIKRLYGTWQKQGWEFITEVTASVDEDGNTSRQLADEIGVSHFQVQQWCRMGRGFGSGRFQGKTVEEAYWEVRSGQTPEEGRAEIGRRRIEQGLKQMVDSDPQEAADLVGRFTKKNPTFSRLLLAQWETPGRRAVEEALPGPGITEVLDGLRNKLRAVGLKVSEHTRWRIGERDTLLDAADDLHFYGDVFRGVAEGKNIQPEDITGGRS
jgi:hypothetical protein